MHLCREEAHIDEIHNNTFKGGGVIISGNVLDVICVCTPVQYVISALGRVGIVSTRLVDLFERLRRDWDVCKCGSDYTPYRILQDQVPRTVDFVN